MIEKLYRIAEGLNSRFQDGDDPFYIATRLAEECGEVTSQVSHFEHKGVKAEKLGPAGPGRVCQGAAGRDARCAAAGDSLRPAAGADEVG